MSDKHATAGDLRLVALVSSDTRTLDLLEISSRQLVTALVSSGMRALVQLYAALVSSGMRALVRL